MAQVALLREGDIIKRFPANTTDAPMNQFDDARTKDISIYTIRLIDPKNTMFSLVGFSTKMFVSSGEVGRVFIKAADLIDQKIWWT